MPPKISTEPTKQAKIIAAVQGMAAVTAVWLSSHMHTDRCLRSDI
jgi:hypothetical protein